MKLMVRVVVLIMAVMASWSISPADATFPGGNGRIAYYDFAQDPVQIHSIMPDGSGVQQLTSSERNSSQPEWSANGNRIAFVRGAQLGRGRSSLLTMQADGSGIQNVLPRGPRGRKEILSPSWSPDGTQIVFCAEGRRPPALFVVASDGSGMSRISRGRHVDCIPSWSPDGSRIAFTTVRRGHWEIATMDPDGSSRDIIVSGATNDSADWSPDGAHLVFERRAGSGRYDIFIVDADGTDRARITDTPRRWEWSPAFSPDGTRIVFGRGTSHRFAAPSDIWTVNLGGAAATRITDTPDADEYWFSWQAT